MPGENRFRQSLGIGRREPGLWCRAAETPGCRAANSRRKRASRSAPLACLFSMERASRLLSFFLGCRDGGHRPLAKPPVIRRDRPQVAFPCCAFQRREILQRFLVAPAFLDCGRVRLSRDDLRAHRARRLLDRLSCFLQFPHGCTTERLRSARARWSAPVVLVPIVSVRLARPVVISTLAAFGALLHGLALNEQVRRKFARHVIRRFRIGRSWLRAFLLPVPLHRVNAGLSAPVTGVAVPNRGEPWDGGGGTAICASPSRLSMQSRIWRRRLANG